MKRFILLTLSAVLTVSALLLSGCVREELPDNRDLDYGYVQFKVYKEASYANVTKASGDYALDSLSQAGRMQIVLINTSDRNRTISQYLTLSYSDYASADFGLRSAKLRLLAGQYEVVSYTLYDNLDNQIGNPVTVSGTLTVTAGGLEVFDLTASVAPRGTIRFNLVKDMSAFEQIPTDSGIRTKSGESSDRLDRGYTFDEIASLSITLINIDTDIDEITYENLPVTFDEYFEGEEHYDGKDGVQGYRTSSSVADTLVYAPAGRYKISRYQVFDDDDVLLETMDFSSDAAQAELEEIVVEDNALTEADVPVTLVEADAYMQDNYALYAIWKALDGEHWSYQGQTYTLGCNWDFNKDPDLWCDQPGVQVHENGRIASIDLSGFGISGELPDAIGQLDQLVQLALGDHNETRRYHSQSSTAQQTTAPYPVRGTAEDRAAWVDAKYKNFGRQQIPQMSPACALALREHGMTSVAATMYDGMTTAEISRLAAGNRTPADYEIHTYDMNHGVLTNNLTGISDAIGNLSRLESLSIANAPITADKFPSAAAMSRLTSVTDFEIYNCPNLESLPEGVAQMPSLITVNLSNNEFSAEESFKALDAVAKSTAGRTTMQILYYLQNGLEALPESVGRMASLGMLNVAYNNIKGELPAFGSAFVPEELTFDNNAITRVPENFCSLDALDSFSIGYNELEEFPNFFSSDERYAIMTSINVAHNNIKALPDNFNGVRTVTLTLSGNPIETFPSQLAETDSYVEQLVMQSCGMKNFPEGCLGGANTHQITTLDLQFNNLTDIPDDFSAQTLPYLYGMDLSSNSFSEFPLEPLNVLRLTAFGIRGQRNAAGERCLSQWPNGLYTHTGLRGFYIGSNDLRVINDEISYMIYYLDISDNPNIIFDASDICSAWSAGAYILYYDTTQQILNCDAMLD